MEYLAYKPGTNSLLCLVSLKRNKMPVATSVIPYNMLDGSTLGNTPEFHEKQYLLFIKK